MLVYVDTSVFGGVFDEEFAEASRAFFDEVRGGRFDALVSSVVLDELLDAPEQVRRFYASLGPRVTVAELSEAALELVRRYIAAGIVGERPACCRGCRVWVSRRCELEFSTHCAFRKDSVI